MFNQVHTIHVAGVISWSSLYSGSQQNTAVDYQCYGMVTNGIIKCLKLQKVTIGITMRICKLIEV